MGDTAVALGSGFDVRFTRHTRGKGDQLGQLERSEWRHTAA